jgi:hypothetical protein
MRAIVITALLSVTSSTYAYADELGYSELPEHTVFIGLGINFRHFGPRATTAPVARTVTDTGVPFGRDGGDAWTFDERAGLRLMRPFYVAVDFEFGNLSYNPANENNCTSMLAGLASFGATGEAGMFRLGAELTAGVAQYSFDREWSAVNEMVLEARARADLWISPWGTLGLVVSRSALHRDDWMAGMYIGAHADPYAGLNPYGF